MNEKTVRIACQKNQLADSKFMISAYMKKNLITNEIVFSFHWVVYFERRSAHKTTSLLDRPI